MIGIAYVCWGVFIALWIAGDAYNLVRDPRPVRVRRAVGLGGRTGRIAAGAVVVLLLIARRSGVFDILSIDVASDAAVAFAGAALLVAATAFTLWARISLGAMWSSTPMIKSSHQLRTDGPYGITRHPIYSGMPGMLLGTTILTTSVLLLVGVLVFATYTAAKIRTEERLLVETFGEDYGRYQRSVPVVIPFLGGMVRRRGHGRERNR